MSCYFRHMQDVFEDLGITVTSENKKQMDAVLHRLVDVAYKDCSPTWKAIKEEIKVDPDRRKVFTERLKKALAEEGIV